MLRLGFLAAFPGKFLQQFPLPLTQICRGLHHHLDNLFSPAIAPQMRHPLIFKMIQMAGLGSGSYFERLLAFQGRNHNFIPQRCLGKTYGNPTNNIISFTNKNGVIDPAKASG